MQKQKIGFKNDIVAKKEYRENQACKKHITRVKSLLKDTVLSNPE
jgi:hypothetical protein